MLRACLLGVWRVPPVWASYSPKWDASSGAGNTLRGGNEIRAHLGAPLRPLAPRAELGLLRGEWKIYEEKWVGNEQERWETVRYIVAVNCLHTKTDILTK